jgi:hypothetical protein
MSLAGAIESLRNAVPSPENRTEPREAAPCKAVPSVPAVPSEKSKTSENEEYPVKVEAGSGLKSKNGEVSNFSFLRNLRNPPDPLSDSAFTALIAKVAHDAKLSPTDLWAFLSLEDIEFLRTGDPNELRALWAFAASRGRTGNRTKGGHDLPFPGEAEAPGTDGIICCGDCAHFQPDRIGDGHGIGRCRQGIEPRGGVMYPGVERVCRGFSGRAKTAGYHAGKSRICR